MVYFSSGQLFGAVLYCDLELPAMLERGYVFEMIHLTDIFDDNLSVIKQSL